MADIPTLLAEALRDRYRLERELGQGGMATVYLAHDLKHDRQVAVKVLRPELGAVLGAERFLREIALSARLTHPHILPLHDSGEAGSFLYYVMPFVEGESLRDRLQREKQLPMDDALQTAREVADALSYAHSHGVIHRDIKPENILLESGHAVVADFGIAKAISAAGGQTLTQTGVAIGSPQYMSPEQAAGQKDLDGRSDLYSLGCVLYEMLAGEPPFTGPTVESVVRQHLMAIPPPITQLRPAVPAEVAAALERALSKTPADRFNPVAQFAEALSLRAPAGPTVPRTAAAVPSRRSWQRLGLIGAAAVVFIAAAISIGRWLRPGSSGAGHPRTVIAVLPFENLSAQGPYGYFAGGLHDELLTQLSKISALKVISRTSVVTYAGSSKGLKEIADELAAGTIVEGSVQVAGDRLRVNVQLIDAATDEHLWAEGYDRTLADVFAVQSEIAQRIVEAVGGALTGAERQVIASVPTTNAEAYRLYLQGRDYMLRPAILQRNLEVAQQLLERALALDPGFALAHAALSEVHGRMYWWRYDPTQARAARQREEAETALRLAPDLPQAHAAMGMAYYWGQRDYQRAMPELRLALKGLPNDARTWAWIGALQRRLGQWDEALITFEKSIQLDPRDANLYLDQGGNTYMIMHRYPEAVRAYDRALNLAPDLYAAAIMKGWAYVRWQGQFDTLRTVIDHLPEGLDLGSLGLDRVAQRASLFLSQRQPDSLLRTVKEAHLAIFQGQLIYLPASLYAAWAHQLRGEHAAARAAFDSAVVLLDSADAALPDDYRIHAARGMALAGSGRRDEALKEAQWIQQSVIYRGDALEGPQMGEYRARILVQAGQADAALEEIERLLSAPSPISVYLLRLDPRFDPIRSDPRFQALLVKYAPAKAAS